MQFDLNTGQYNFTVLNNIFTGFYGFSLQGNYKRLFNFSSPDNPISNFQTPYGAKLLSNNDTIAVGQFIKPSCLAGNRSGVLFYEDNSIVYGGCFGIDLSATTSTKIPTYYYGFNYYNAFYPAGYYSPPWGENLSIFKSNTNGFSNLQAGGCNNITVSEYNELFGIPSESATDVSLNTSTLANSSYSLLVTPQIVCPPASTVAFYFNEINFNQIPGTTLALGGATTYNDNPIPTSLDNFIYKVNGRYQLTPDPASTTENPIMDIVISNGRAQPSYTFIEDKINNLLCHASLLETSISSNVGSNGSQLLNAPDLSIGGDGGQVSFNSQVYSYYWNFLYKENAYSLPFNNYNSNPSSTPGADNTQLFNPILSSTNYFWKYRQCPSIVDFLPWTIGASIYACPSNFFEIPYYAINKKFGFYGTRFLNSCKSLNLSNNIGNVPNASELNLTVTGQVFPPELEPDGIDIDGNWNFSIYDNLLNIAAIEENYSNVYAFNKGFFLWINSGNLLNDNSFGQISTNSGFIYELNSLFGQFTTVFPSGIYSFTGKPPNILSYSGLLNSPFLVISSGTDNNILLNDDIYQNFYNNSLSLLNQSQFGIWKDLENKYSSTVLNADGTLNENFYQNIISGKQQRIRTRYFENILRGNPIDLYPLNTIEFSTDQASGYIENSYWGRSTYSFGNDSPLPTVNRRYFYGAYGESSMVDNLEDSLNNIVNNQTNYFYPGFFNDTTCTSDFPNPNYDSVTGGIILDNLNRSFSTIGWLAIGYNEIGKLNKNFSCFTPIFIQQPVTKVFCKIGQTPTFRSMAVDYHTIPEDKISRKYPEILYWAVKLKLLDCNSNYLYPMQYKWARVSMANFNNFISAPFSNMNLIDYSNSTGEWCALEGNNQNCTLIHPNECYPIYNTGQTDPDNYVFLKGAKYGIDDQYYYFSIASGRFGVRISNPSALNIENWLQFDISFKNGANVTSQIGVNFIVEDYLGNTNTISIPQTNTNPIDPYRGYEFDNTQIPETAVQQKVPPPNAGYGDVTSYTFQGPTLYRGELRTFTPSFLADARALYETWGKLIDYGPLIQLGKELEQSEGDLIYGYKHLPTCSNYAMGLGQKGVKSVFTVNGYNIQQFTIPQQAVAALTIQQGTPYDNIYNIGNLYPPLFQPGGSQNLTIGNSWQFQQNLGTIKRFGFSTTVDSNGNSTDIVPTENPQNTNTTLSQIVYDLKNKILKPTDLAGSNCGYTPYGAGRYLGYYLEAYDSFYILCDPLKKKNVQDLNFISPGYRMGNSAIQYNWLGKPYNTYLDRRSLYGPYAYKWRVNRHNRDRNGNGYSEGFYSMVYEEKYSLMYDLPAVFGIYVRTPNSNSNYLSLISSVNSQREGLFQGGYNMTNIKSISFGTIADPGQEGVFYGNVMWSCDPNTPFGSSITGLCNYMTNALSLSSSPNFGDYSCPMNLLKQGSCFDACLSERYSHGFIPGGKALDLFGNNGNVTRLVPIGTVKNGNVSQNDEVSVIDKTTIFRSSNSTPYYYQVQNQNGSFQMDNTINGINSCSDGGSDFCSYTTPTIFLNNLFTLLGKSTDFNVFSSIATQTYDQNLD